MGLLFGCSTAVVVLSLVSLAFLIIATITPPAVHSFGLAKAENLVYGALGYCTLDTANCVTGSPYYKVSSLTTLTDWKMDDNARDTLAKMMIVIPVAAFLTLLSFFFNLFSHFKTFGRSTAFYIVTFIVALLAFIGAAFSVIVTFLLFYPHVQWPAWLMIPAAVFNLVSVPLAFFALRTTPRSVDGDEDYDEDEMEESNLTDLTDGINFQKTQSFKLNDIPPSIQQSVSTFEKFAPNSTLKVITDDSASSHDQLEKVSVRDYSRPLNTDNNTAPYNGYKGYNLNTSPAIDSTKDSGEGDGAPNLVSSQNYNKGGAIRSEAPTFQPQSARPEFGNTPYSSTYTSAQYKPGPPTHPRLNNSSSSNNQTSGPTIPASSGVLGTSNHDGSNFSSEDFYDNDDGSDFTSVSQRAANPRYYRGLNQGRSSLFPDQQVIPPPAHGQAYQPQGGYYPPSTPVSGQFTGQSNHSGYADYMGSPPTAQGGNPVGGYQQGTTPPQQSRPSRDTSAALLSANPDFAVSGPAFQKTTFAKKAKPMPSGSYKPAYKRVQGGSASSSIPAASLSADSPYNIR